MILPLCNVQFVGERRKLWKTFLLGRERFDGVSSTLSRKFHHHRIRTGRSNNENDPIFNFPFCAVIGILIIDFPSCLVVFDKTRIARFKKVASDLVIRPACCCSFRKVANPAKSIVPAPIGFKSASNANVPLTISLLGALSN